MTRRDSPYPMHPVHPAPRTEAPLATAASSSFDPSPPPQATPRGAARQRWSRRRRELAAIALLSCLGLLALVRWLALQPYLDSVWRVEDRGVVELVRASCPP